jgi:predicted  nucleic acid-binding Zn-ribbon protein
MTDEMNTSPTMETLLARMNEWGVSITGELVEIKKGYAELRQSVDDLRKGQDELRKGQDELRKGQDVLRSDMNSGLHRVKLKIQGLNDTFLEMQADIRQLNIQIEKLEAESLSPK